MPKESGVSSITPARRIAAETLREIETNPFAQANETLARRAADAQLRSEDVRLARTIIFGVLRHALTLDFYYSAFLKQPASKLDPRLRLCLRMAAAQKYLMSRIPDYAIVNETVELARRIFRVPAHQLGFLNAALRKLVAEAEPVQLPAGNRVRDLSVRFSFPLEFAGLLVKKYGTHKAAAIMEACNQEPSLTIRANLLRISVGELQENLLTSGFDVQKSGFSAEALTVVAHPAGASLFETAEFQNGQFYVQDEASQMIAHQVAAGPGEKILDMCSAPGGKNNSHGRTGRG